MIELMSECEMKALALDFTPLEMMKIKGRVERGLATDEEKEKLSLYNLRTEAKEKEARNKAEILRMQRKAKRKKEIEESAALLQEKYCPLLRQNCIAQECAWFKVIETNWKTGEDYENYQARGKYVCMCAINIPEYRDRVVTERDAYDL